MRTLRHARRYPRCRQRVVVAGSRGGGLIDFEDASGYEEGLHGLGLLRKHFPGFFAEHVAHRPLSHSLLFGACCAFWRLMEQRGLVLIWPDDDGRYAGGLEGECSNDPVEALVSFEWVMPHYLTDMVSYFLSEARVEYWGLGIEMIMDYDMTAFEPSPLLLTLWHLFSKTAWSLGARVFDLPLDRIDEDIVLLIRRLPPLPADTAPDQLWAGVTIPEALFVAVSDVVGYAFARTDNPLANHSRLELDEVYGGDYDTWDWDEWEEIVQKQREAQLIQAAFESWEARISAHPHREIPALARMLYQAARASKAQPTGGRPLIDVVGLGEPAFQANDDEDYDDTEA